MKLTFGNLPTITGLTLTRGAIAETTVTINDDDDPAVQVSFGASVYTVEESDDATTALEEENKVTVTVTLDQDPKRNVEIEITAANQGGATTADYSGVPTSVTFCVGRH